MLRIFLFGQPHFSWNDEPFRFVARSQVLPLLALLLMHRAAPVTRDTLAFTLWTDETEQNARTNLRRHLNYLRQALPQQSVPWLVQEHQTLQWNPAAPYWCDVAEFEHEPALNSKLCLPRLALYSAIYSKMSMPIGCCANGNACVRSMKTRSNSL